MSEFHELSANNTDGPSVERGDRKQLIQQGNDVASLLHRTVCSKNISILGRSARGNHEDNGRQSSPSNALPIHNPDSHETDNIEENILKCHSYPLLVAR